MCGICGKLDFSGKGLSESLFRKMCQTLSHRGPDDEGILIDPPIGLGHRRLSIIDVSSAGYQPMSSEDDRIWIVFNGEIYDFLKIREELKSKGHILKSRTDTETIIHHEQAKYSTF